MASFGNHLSFFLLLVLFLSPQIQAREGKFFSFFTHFRTNNVKDAQLLLAKAESPAQAPGPASALAPAPAPSAQAIGSTIPSGPAPEPEFLDMGEGYGLYGTDSSSSAQYSPTKETSTTTNFENELLNEDFKDQSYKTGYPQTNFRSNYNNEVYTKNYNTEGYRSNDNNGKELYYNNNNNNYGNNNGYERKREGMSDTRFMENGKYHYNVDTENESYNLNGYDESGRGRTENEGYDEKMQNPNEFDTMEEYEKQQEAQGYTP
ncbi:protein E6-like [Lotus japonicus]|uniref:Protein E6-like n=1 Tax=Lotus japonicus TaxID=34305 RepID=I3SDG5_LOTJA|nr:protein E6-like [Lotus japonicus]AFK38307.1 unknown [Lotus japonicus]